MKKINFTVEKTNDGFSAFAEIDNGIAATVGDNLAELKQNAVEAVNALLFEAGKKPVTENNVAFLLDIKQFFEFYDVINVTHLANRLKINRGLLSQYINGDKKPSSAQTQRILQGVKSLGKELAEVEFA